MEKLVHRIRVQSQVWSVRTLSSLRGRAELSPAGLAFDSLMDAVGTRVVVVACSLTSMGMTGNPDLHGFVDSLPTCHWFDETMGSVLGRCMEAGGIFCCRDMASSAVLVCSLCPELFASMESRFGIPRTWVG